MFISFLLLQDTFPWYVDTLYLYPERVLFVIVQVRAYERIRVEFVEQRVRTRITDVPGVSLCLSSRRHVAKE